MSGVKVAESLRSRMKAISAVPAIAASPDQKIFIGGITKSF